MKAALPVGHPGPLGPLLPGGPRGGPCAPSAQPQQAKLSYFLCHNYMRKGLASAAPLRPHPRQARSLLDLGGGPPGDAAVVATPYRARSPPQPSPRSEGTDLSNPAPLARRPDQGGGRGFRFACSPRRGAGAIPSVGPPPPDRFPQLYCPHPGAGALAPGLPGLAAPHRVARPHLLPPPPLPAPEGGRSPGDLAQHPLRPRPQGGRGPHAGRTHPRRGQLARLLPGSRQPAAPRILAPPGNHLRRGRGRACGHALPNGNDPPNSHPLLSRPSSPFSGGHHACPSTLPRLLPPASL